MRQTRHIRSRQHEVLENGRYVVQYYEGVPMPGLIGTLNPEAQLVASVCFSRALSLDFIFFAVGLELAIK